MPRPELNMQCTLFAGNVPNDTITDDLHDVFQKYGTVNDVYMPRDYYTKRTRGFAYIEFEKREEAEDALENLSGYKFRGNTLTVEFAKGKRKGNDENRGRYVDRDRNRDDDYRSRRRYDDDRDYRSRRYDGDDYDRRGRDYPRKRRYDDDYDDDRSHRRDRSRSRDRKIRRKSRSNSRRRGDRDEKYGRSDAKKKNGGRYFDADDEKSNSKTERNQSPKAAVEKSSPKNDGEGFMSLDSPAPKDTKSRRSRSRDSSASSRSKESPRGEIDTKSMEKQSSDKSRSPSAASRDGSASRSPSSERSN